MNVRLRHVLPAVATIAFATVAGCDLLRGYTEGRGGRIETYETTATDRQELGAARFVFDDFHGLSTDTLETTALPWKVAGTALLLADDPSAPPTQARLRTILSRFGFLYPERIANWPWPKQPTFADAPLGLVDGQIRRRLPAIELDTVNLGCAGCHAGVLHDADGNATGAVWLGLPNTSLDLDGYVDAVFDALTALGDDPETLLAALRQAWPDTSEREIATIRRFVWPRLAKRLPELARAGGALPFRNGGPARSNGVDALKHRLGARPAHDSAAAVSIPMLFDVSLRSSLLVDGLYVARGTERFQARDRGTPDPPERLAGIVGYFTVPTMGVAPDRVPDMLPRIADAVAFLFGTMPPPFPGRIDTDRAERGERIYAAHCASCHGSYREIDGMLRLTGFPNRLVPQAEIATDRARIDAVSPGLVEAINDSEIGRKQIAARSGGYVATALTGLWATAPYLHNGSVPTLWHLMRPTRRPGRFQVGGHRLDLDRVGIAGQTDGHGDWLYPEDYRPWSTPSLSDSTTPGQHNGGHVAPFDALDETAKDDLLEYLKRL
jgi:mono/diheme cytochrome c family protein